MSFITAVDLLWDASRIVGEHLKCALRLGDAVTYAIEAEVLEAWGVRHPEKWKRWCKVQGAQDSEEYRDLKREMLSEPESMKRARRAWLELAEVLEKAVARPSGSPKAELLALRQAAEDEDWSDCLEETRRLLRRLPVERALELTQKQVAARLPVFERHQPGVTWPREFIEAAIHPDRRASLVWSDDYDFDGPGANNFIRAVSNLWEACLITGDEPKRLEVLEAAIAGAIMAEEVESFGARHLEQWKHWYHEPPETRGEEYNRFRDARVNDPEARSVGRKAWLGLADELEKALRNSG
jgi:hypothetical protein